MGEAGSPVRSLIEPRRSEWVVPAVFERDVALHVRLFNAGGYDAPGDIDVGFEAGKIELVELDSRIIEDLKAVGDGKGRRTIRLRIPRLGIRTLRFREVKALPRE